MKTKLLFIAALFAAAIGFAQSVTVLQVEQSRDGGYDPAPIAGVAITDPQNASLSPVSKHASEVAQRIVSLGCVKAIEVQHFSYYINRDGLGYMRVNPAGMELWPKPARWQVENHSWGGTGGYYDPKYDLEVCQRCDRRAERDNVVVVVALPNKGQSVLAKVPLMRLAKNCILVGSSNFQQEGGTPHILTDEPYTSYAAPKVSAAAALLISDALAAGKAYRWDEIRQVLIDSGDPTEYGVPRLNVSKARELWRQRKGF